MAIAKIEVERFSVISSKPFKKVVEALKGSVGRLNVGELTKSSKSAGSFADLEKLIGQNMGSTGLMLFEELDRRGVDYDKIDDRDAIFTLDDPRNWGQYDAILERCINHSRALYALKILNDWGIPTVNTAHVADVCGNKLLTSFTRKPRSGSSSRSTPVMPPPTAFDARTQISSSSSVTGQLLAVPPRAVFVIQCSAVR